MSGTASSVGEFGEELLAPGSSNSSSSSTGGEASGDSASLLTFRRFFLGAVLSSDTRLAGFFVLDFADFVGGAGDSSIISSSCGSSCFSYKHKSSIVSHLPLLFFAVYKASRTASSLMI